MKKLKDTVIFYGNGLIPLSKGCKFCHQFNYLCAGSIFESPCPIRELSEEEEKDNKKIISILKDIDYNYALLFLMLENDRAALEEHKKRLYEKISERFSQNEITLTIEIFSDLLKNSECDLVNNLKFGCNYIKANLETFNEIEKALKYTDNEVVSLRSKHNL